MPSINYTPKPYKGKSVEELRKLREKHLNPGKYSFLIKFIRFFSGIINNISFFGYEY